ncbi:hypothetical protein [Methanobacterium spitsbergense]|uniref:Uncharacterized protein n=1 Tax=Methanobacterium spitsbergense TaxID=2874285 RepID=A0A8T5V5Z9_9EURY|nr:hypothetical protein [Methanobacterium spitsbergense]MBZ2167065.1 hypothetical protein [Methanobacterium spitsbergense]
MDVYWVNIEFELGKVEEYDRKSDQSIDRISIGSTTIKIFFNQMSKREENYVRVILIDNLLGYEYPVVRGESI